MSLLYFCSTLLIAEKLTKPPKGETKIKSTAQWHQLPKHMNGGKVEREGFN